LLYVWSVGSFGAKLEIFVECVMRVGGGHLQRSGSGHQCRDYL
jgi:hypothetical protein